MQKLICRFSFLPIGLLSLALLSTPPAWTEEQSGATLSVAPKVIYGDDDRIDVFEETDQVRREYAASTCLMVPATGLTDNGDSTFTLQTFPYTVSGLPPCFGEAFADQRISSSQCTAFLAGFDIVVTAGHCDPLGNLASFRYVFGHVMKDATTQTTIVDASQVYRGIEVISQVNDGVTDYAVVRLDREVSVPDALPLAIRRTGTVAVDTPLGVIGYPWGLPKKIAFGGNTKVKDTSDSIFFVANLDTYQGNSGSPVFNVETGVVEGILVRGEADFDNVGGCFRSVVLPDLFPPSVNGEESTKTTVFASFIPDFNLSKGTVIMDKANYVCSETILITVRDVDLSGFGPLSLLVITDGGDSEMVTLTETGAATGKFTGAIMTSEGAVASGNNRLDVADGDIVTATYDDADDGTGAMATATAQASVTCAPQISITPTSHNFGSVELGMSATRNFVVENTSGGLLVGTGSTDPPFAIQGDGSYSLAGGEQSGVTVAFTPTSGGPFLAAARFSGGGDTAALIGGIGTLPPQIAVEPLTHDFGTVLVGSEQTLSFTVTNVGEGVLSGSASTATPFRVVEPSGYSLGAGATVQITVAFLPRTIGDIGGQVLFTGGAGATATVNGTGFVTAPILNVTTPTLSFGEVVTGESGGATLSFQNDGDATLTGFATALAPFSIVSGSPYTVEPGMSATIEVQFSPVAQGAIAGDLILTGGGGGTVALTGTGISPIQIMPNAVSFGGVEVGLDTLTNLTLSNVSGRTISGMATVSAPFAIVEGGEFSMASGENATISLQFAPLTEGPFAGVISITGDAILSVPVSGTASPSTFLVSPASHDFGPVTVGDTVEADFVLENSGAKIIAGSASVSPPFVLVSSSAFSLGIGEQTTITVSFTPSTAEPLTGAITFSNNVTVTVTLIGTGQAASTFACHSTGGRTGSGTAGDIMVMITALVVGVLTTARRGRGNSPRRYYSL